MLVHFLDHELHLSNAHDLIYRNIVDDYKLGRHILDRANSLAHLALKQVDCGELVPACKVVTFPRRDPNKMYRDFSLEDHTYGAPDRRPLSLYTVLIFTLLLSVQF